MPSRSEMYSRRSLSERLVRVAKIRENSSGKASSAERLLGFESERRERPDLRIVTASKNSLSLWYEDVSKSLGGGASARDDFRVGSEGDTREVKDEKLG